MKIYKLSLLAVAGLMTAACSDIDDIKPEGQYLSQAQLQESGELAESRIEATFAGMFTMMGEPYYTFGTGSLRDDDFGFITSAISNDAEGPDLCYPNSGYNWFSVCGDYTSRTPTYANLFIRYATPYNQMKIANDLIVLYADAVAAGDADAINKTAQARAIRAFDYMSLAQYYQFTYATSKDKPCVPLVTEETTDFANNPRATVEEVYKLIMDDLDYAVANLTADRTDKSRVNLNVAYGLRARANLVMGNYAAAAADAEKAAEGFTPATIDEVSTPSFCNISEHNWIWGLDLTTDKTNSQYATSSSWLSSFSSSGYTAGAGCYAFINNLLYDKIPATDVRKGWWVDADTISPLLNTITWNGATGKELATMEITDVKMAFLPYTNVKFGMISGIGSSANDNDWPMMRVEEMILIQAEGYAKGGNESKAREILTNFVKTYRNPSYTIPTNRTLADEIWFQRRVELWGEGFAMSDVMRLQKPLVRFHDSSSNYPEAFRFNLAATDGWLLLRFPQRETNSNFSLIDNSDGTAPVQDQNPQLRDGVTD